MGDRKISNFSLDTFSECDRIEKVSVIVSFSEQLQDRDIEGASAFAEQSIIFFQRENGLAGTVLKFR